jgi:hypothetical protein
MTASAHRIAPSDDLTAEPTVDGAGPGTGVALAPAITRGAAATRARTGPAAAG